MNVHHDRLRRTAAEQSLLQDDLRELFENRITFNQTLGLHVSSFDPGVAGMEFAMAPALVGHFHYGRLHGGVISAVLDATGGLVVMCAIGERFPDETSRQILARFLKIGTIDLRVDFVRQGLGKRFAATATLIRLGGRVASTQMALRNDEGVLIATGAAAYVVS